MIWESNTRESEYIRANTERAISRGLASNDNAELNRMLYSVVEALSYNNGQNVFMLAVELVNNREFTYKERTKFGRITGPRTNLSDIDRMVTSLKRHVSPNLIFFETDNQFQYGALVFHNLRSNRWKFHHDDMPREE